jgi:coenzyme F420-reducing hydrogenase alpha subunit
MKKKLFNYKWYQQQKDKLEHQKVKKIKEKAKKAPVSATEELDYIKKLLNGEEVEDFGPKEVTLNGPEEYLTNERDFWIKAVYQQTHIASQMSFSEYMQFMGGKGYYK